MSVSMPRTSHWLLCNFPRCVHALFGVHLNISISTSTITDNAFTRALFPVFLSTLRPQIIDGPVLYISAMENPETDVFAAPVPIRNRFPTILLANVFFIACWIYIITYSSRVWLLKAYGVWFRNPAGTAELMIWTADLIPVYPRWQASSKVLVPFSSDGRARH
jgi:hypothetical protein